MITFSDKFELFVVIIVIIVMLENSGMHARDSLPAIRIKNIAHLTITSS